MLGAHYLAEAKNQNILEEMRPPKGYGLNISRKQKLKCFGRNEAPKMLGAHYLVEVKIKTFGGK
jgi:hypothetical protein